MSSEVATLATNPLNAVRTRLACQVPTESRASRVFKVEKALSNLPSHLRFASARTGAMPWKINRSCKGASRRHISMKRQTDGFVRDCGRAGFRLLTVLVVASALCFVAAGKLWAADPATYTVDTYKTWLTQYANAKPDFKRGDVLTAKDLERMRPFVPPGYLEQLNFPNFKAQVIDVIPHTPASTYL